MCVRGREMKVWRGGDTGVNVCVRAREVRFTHAPPIMLSWRVEYILDIIQDKNEHTVNMHK